MALFSKPAEGTWKFAAILLIAVTIPSSIATAIGGTHAGMAFGVAAGFTMAVAPFATTAQALGSAVLAAGLAAVSSWAGQTPWAVAGLMLLAALLQAVTNQHSAGLLTLAPVIVILFGPASLDLTPTTAFAYVVAGGIFGWLLMKVLRLRAEPSPVPTGVAWRHAIVVGVLSAAAMYWSLANQVEHGYWVAVTLVVALRPLPEQRSDTLRGRLLGTLFGAVIAFLVILVLPVPLAAAVAVVCLFLLAVYSMGGAYFMQTLFLTPMLLIFTTLGDAEKGLVYTGERVVYTIAGVGVGVAAAFVLDRWDRSAAEPVT